MNVIVSFFFWEWYVRWRYTHTKRRAHVLRSNLFCFPFWTNVCRDRKWCINAGELATTPTHFFSDTLTVATHLFRMVSGKRMVLCVSSVTSKRCDIWSVGPNSMASVCCCCFSCCSKYGFVGSSFSSFAIFSVVRATLALMTASKCSSSHISNVRLQPGNWLISWSNSCCWAAVCEASGPVAVSSKRGNRSVVNSGSGNSLQIENEMELQSFCDGVDRMQSYRMKTFSKLHAVGISNSSSATVSRLL